MLLPIRTEIIFARPLECLTGKTRFELLTRYLFSLGEELSTIAKEKRKKKVMLQAKIETWIFLFEKFGKDDCGKDMDVSSKNVIEDTLLPTIFQNVYVND